MDGNSLFFWEWWWRGAMALTFLHRHMTCVYVGGWWGVSERKIQINQN